MLIESISLKNFRQFKDEEIEFSVDPDQNVTIIFGENGTGKTTLAQAFFWCFYGIDQTSFKHKDILNKEVAAALKPNEEVPVEVEIHLKHGETEYTIFRKQSFIKGYNDVVKDSNNSEFLVSMKDPLTGTLKHLKPLDSKIEIQSILPTELSSYFFFDGERIENLSKNILSPRTNKDFREAVNGLTGLKATQKALDHFKPTLKNSVIGTLNKEYVNSLDSDLANKHKELEDKKLELYENQEKLEELNNYIEDWEIQKSHKSEELKTFEQSRELQEQKESLELEQDNLEENLTRTVRLAYKLFQDEHYTFFLRPIVYKILNELINKNFETTTYPEINAKTIQKIIDSGICICGEKIEEGGEHEKHLIELMQFLPPNSISSLVNQFVRESKIKFNKESNLINSFEQYLADRDDFEDNIEEIDDKIFKTNNLIKGQDLENIKNIEIQIENFTDFIKDGQRDRDQLIKNNGILDNRISVLKKDIEELGSKNESNQKIKTAINYAERIYDDLNKLYTSKESIVRKELEDSINNFFNTIYNGGLSLEIDENYKIKVKYKDISDEIEASTAQSISIIFAFIASIAKMAKENKSKDETFIEPYPLVMDAPLSSFDKRRIKSICETIPNTAEQVIIFIKDTDGDIAEKYLGNKINKKYTLNKINEVETRIEI